MPFDNKNLEELSGKGNIYGKVAAIGFGFFNPQLPGRSGECRRRRARHRVTAIPFACSPTPRVKLHEQSTGHSLSFDDRPARCMKSAAFVTAALTRSVASGSWPSGGSVRRGGSGKVPPAHKHQYHGIKSRSSYRHEGALRGVPHFRHLTSQR